MRSKIPKDIDIEDTIVGPLTGKQFLWLLGGGVSLLILYHIFDLSLFIVIAILVMGIVSAFAFFRPYNQSLVSFLGHILIYGTKGKRYIWKRGKKQFNPKNKNKEEEMEIIITKKEFPHQKVEHIANILDADGKQEMSDQQFFNSATQNKKSSSKNLMVQSKNVIKEETANTKGARLRNKERNQQLKREKDRESN
ncbi:MAG: PrgI family protein [Patescibacteria group bacterium]|nr:PrgI family protein [Patescibacteria group bacterium]